MRGGVDARLPKGKHTMINVYSEMFLQVCQDYHSLPDPRTLELYEIEFYYNGRRKSLQEATKPRPGE